MGSLTSTHGPYPGSQRKLVLAFDVGTTYSAISYSVLEPDKIPTIMHVAHFPASEQWSASSKIPTAIYYDQSGNVRAVGAEAMLESVHVVAHDEQWVKAEWFKLHLRTGTNAELNGVPPLPLKKSVVDILADFMRYLLNCSSSYIQDHHVNGRDLWQSVEGDIDFVLSHPNGWEGVEQRRMRKAAVLAGMIPDTAQGHARLVFVTEGEASLKFALRNGLPSRDISWGDCVAVVDAGGGTIATSFYGTTINGASSKSGPNMTRISNADHSSSKEVVFHEVAPPQCDLQGSFFVTIRARIYLENYLEESAFYDDVDEFVRIFDKSTKIRFRSDTEIQYIRFGCARGHLSNLNIRFGQLKLLGSDVALLFQPSVDSIVNAVLVQMQASDRPVSLVVLVGGFAANDWLHEQVLSALKPLGLNVFRPDNYANKAVAEGAVLFYFDQLVCNRYDRAAVCCHFA